MYKRTLLAVLASAALLAACDKNNEDEVIPVSFSSFGFRAEDNAGVLKSDYIEEDITSDAISFTLPYGTDPEAVKSLVPTFTVTEGASVNKADASGAPDGVEIVSGQTAVDFSSDVQFVIFLKNNYKAYTVSVKIAEPARWSQVAVSSLVMNGAPVLTVNPVDGTPYVAGTSANADGVAEPHLLKLEGSELKDVAGALVSAKTDGLSLNFNASGVPFVAFADGSASNNMSVMKVSGGKGVYVGEAGKMFATSVAFTSVSAVFPISDNDVWCAHYNNSRNVSVARRALNLAHFDGTAWTNGTAIAGRDASACANGVFGKTINGTSYMYVYGTKTSSVPSHLSLYRLDGGTWTTIFEDLHILGTSGEEEVSGYSAFLSDFDIASDGSVYLLIGATFGGDGVYRFGVVKYDPESKKQSIVGGAMTDVPITEKSQMGSLALDANDVPYVTLTYKDGDVYKAAVRHIDSKTRAWSDKFELSAASSSATVRFDESGKGYIVCLDETSGSKKYVLYSTAE